MKRTTTFAAIALTGAVALSPMFALADTGVSVSADANVSAKAHGHSILNDLQARFPHKSDLKAEAHASTSADHKAAAAAKKADKQQDRAQGAVDSRIALLQKLETRITAMNRLTAVEKTALTAELDAQISALNDLKARIGSDTSTSTLITDIKAMRTDYRSYLLVMPRTAILAAANRVMNIADQMTAVGTKLDQRIDSAKDSGTDVSVAEHAYADYTAKIASAKAHATAAIDLVVDLKIDNGDTSKLAANTQALKEARADIQAARADLRDARKDMMSIMKIVKGHGSLNASTTASVNH